MALTESERRAAASRAAAAAAGDSPAAGKTFVLTGALPTLGRSEAEKMI